MSNLDRLYFYAREVVLGNKPIAHAVLEVKHLNEVEKIANKYEIKFFIDDSIREEYGFVYVFLYRHEHLLEVIMNLPNKPETVYEHWILGKAFGYSEEAIDTFISSRGLL